ncbi:MAG: PD-(D/E)XK nuclease superfamily protein [Methanomassiliicoccales archaeon PtaU1.Bin124]|nr:MAG: PD-(D/E)XK nuclease superfamily protein [Methanomassiliicoccales archaeon PtaU1.Bin124]
MAEPIISASELERFCYCPLSWWLGLQTEAQSQQLEQGVARHEDVSRELRNILDGEKRALAWERAVLWFSLIATVMALIGLFIFNRNFSRDIIWLSALPTVLWIGLILYLVMHASLDKKNGVRRAERVFAIASVVTVFLILIVLITYDVPMVLAEVALVLSLFWLIGTSFALYNTLKSQREIEIRRKEIHLTAKIAYIGNDTSRLLRSERYGITGRPDYILEEGDELVPVELKSGRQPRGPLFSHIVQLAAYCLIMSDSGEKVTRGILKYGDTEFDIDFDEGLRQIVTDKAGEMRSALKGDIEVHRNHNRPGKCQSCSRREQCPEKIV